MAPVFPPMRRGAGLARNLARFVHDRHRAIAGLFGDRALDDVDDGRTVGVAVPGYNAAWLNDELAQAQRAAVNPRWLLGQINRGKNHIGYSLGRIRGRLRCVRAFRLQGTARPERQLQITPRRARPQEPVTVA
jgi:hypothetical protein